MSFEPFTPVDIEKFIGEYVKKHEPGTKWVVEGSTLEEKSESIHHFYSESWVVIHPYMMDNNENPMYTRIQTNVYNEWKTANLFYYSVIRNDATIRYKDTIGYKDTIVHTGQYLLKEESGTTTMHHFTLIEPVFKEGSFVYDEKAFEGVPIEESFKKRSFSEDSEESFPPSKKK